MKELNRSQSRCAITLHVIYYRLDTQQY